MLRLALLALLVAVACGRPAPPAAEAPMLLPEALCLSQGGLLVADPGASAVWRLAPDGRLAQVQGDPVGPDFVQAGGLASLPDGGFLATGMGRGLRGLARAGASGWQSVDGAGPPFRLPLGVATDGRKAWVADSLARRVVEVDLATGDRRPLPAPFRHPSGVAWRAGVLWVSDTDAGEVLALDPTDGSLQERQGGLTLPTALAALADGSLLVLESGGLSRLHDGDLSRVAEGFAQPAGLASDGRLAWVSDPARGQVVEVTLANGRQRVALTRRAAEGGKPDHVVVLDEATALVTGGGLHRVSLRDGVRTREPAEGLVRPFGICLLQGRPLVTDPGRAAVMGLQEPVSAFGLRGRGPRLVEPEAILAHPDGGLLVSDIALGAVLRVDPATGDRSLLEAEGAPLEEPSALALREERLLVADLQRGTVLDWDLERRRRIELRKGLRSPGALAVDGERLYVADDGQHAVLDERGVVSGGRGPELRYPSGLAVLPSGNLLVADHETGDLMEVRPSDGDRRLLQPELVSPGAMVALDGRRVLVADSGYGGLVEVDLETGRRTPRPAPDLREPEGLLAAPGGLLASDLLLRGLVRLSPSGETEKVAEIPRPAGLALEGSSVLVANQGPPDVALVDPVSGVTTWYGAQGLVEPQAVAVSGGRVLVADPGLGAVVEVGRGPVTSGLPLEPMALVRTGGQVLATDGATGAVMDLQGGVVSMWGRRGSGPPVLEATACVEVGGSLIVADAGQGALFRVDPATGDRTVVSAGWPVAEAPPPRITALAPGGWFADASTGRLLRLDGTDAGPAGLLPTAMALLGGDLVVADSGTSTLGVPGREPLYRHLRCEGLAALPDGVLLATDRLTGRVYRLQGGRRTPVGPRFLGPAGVALVDGRRAAVLDERAAALYLLDFRSGEATRLDGRGPDLVYPSHVAGLPDGDLVVSDESALLRVDPRTGDRSRIPVPGLRRPRALGVDGGRLLVGDDEGVLEVDPVSGRSRRRWKSGHPSPG